MLLPLVYGGSFYVSEQRTRFKFWELGLLLFDVRTHLDDTNKGVHDSFDSLMMFIMCGHSLT